MQPGPPPGPYGSPAPYGPQPYGPQYPPPAVRPTNVLAIIALIAAFVLPPAGIVCGIIARRQIRQSGEAGDGLALAGLIIGWCFTALYVILILIWVVLIVFSLALFATIPDTFPSTGPSDFPSPFPTS